MQILGKMGQKRKTPFKQIIFSKWHHKHILIHCTLRTPKWATKQVWGGKMVKPLVSLADGVFSNIRFNHFNSPLIRILCKDTKHPLRPLHLHISGLHLHLPQR